MILGIILTGIRAGRCGKLSGPYKPFIRSFYRLFARLAVCKIFEPFKRLTKYSTV